LAWEKVEHPDGTQTTKNGGYLTNTNIKYVKGKKFVKTSPHLLPSRPGEVSDEYYNFVNTIQHTRWSINTDMLEILKTKYKKNPQK
jgi:hypothetical protein